MPHSTPSISRRSLLAASALGVLPLHSARAQGNFPNRMIKMIVSSGPGSSVDALARQIAPAMEARLGQTIVLENQAGSGGLLAMNQQLRAPKDGHTITIASSTYAIAPSMYKLPYDAEKDIQPISILTSNGLVLAVPPRLGVNTLKELITLAKSRPSGSPLTYGTAGVGTTTHLATELLALSSGTRLLHVPYKGQTQYVTDVLGGQIDFGFMPIISTVPYLKAGTLKAIGVSTLARSNILPQVPTLDEAGLPGYSVDSWIALLTSAGTPDAVVQKLNEAVVHALRDKTIEKAIQEERGGSIVASSVQNASRTVASDIQRFGDVIKRAGIKLD